MKLFLPGLGAVTTTFIAGCLLARTGQAQPIGSLTQLGTLRLGKRTEARVPRIADFVPRIADFVPLAGLHDLEFAAWDLFPDNAYEAAVTAGVLSAEHVSLVKCAGCKARSSSLI